MSERILKYLQRHAEPEVLLDSWSRQYAHSLVIPAFRETVDDIRSVTAALNNTSDLLMILVNNSHQANDPAGLSLEKALLAGQPATRLADNITLVRSGRPDYLLVDRFRSGRCISSRHGVGLARKTGCDIALALQQRGQIDTDWLYTSDADAILPDNYFEQPVANQAVADVYSFQHVAEPGLEQACELYDIRLLYHTAGLAWAGSNYAFPTIGSLMRFRADSYAAVRGFPRRSTGEDFYLLNKLRKLGPVTVTADKPVQLAGRLSERVPVGTGMALAAIRRLEQPLQEYLFEHPACFTDLRQLLAILRRLATDQPADYRFDDKVFDAWAGASGFYACYEKKQRQRPTPAVMEKHLADWLDGLRTRQLVHHVRDHRHGSVSVSELFPAPFVPGSPADITSLHDVLARAVYRPALAGW